MPTPYDKPPEDDGKVHGPHEGEMPNDNTGKTRKSTFLDIVTGVGVGALMIALFIALSIIAYYFGGKITAKLDAINEGVTRVNNTADGSARGMQVAVSQFNQGATTAVNNLSEAARSIRESVQDQVRMQTEAKGLMVRQANMTAAAAEAIDRLSTASQKAAEQSHQDQESLGKIVNVNAQAEDARLAAIQQNTAQIAATSARAADSNEALYKLLKEANDRLDAAQQGTAQQSAPAPRTATTPSPPPLPTAEQRAQEQAAAATASSPKASQPVSATPAAPTSTFQNSKVAPLGPWVKVPGTPWKYREVPAGQHTRAYKACEIGDIGLSGESWIYGIRIRKYKDGIWHKEGIADKPELVTPGVPFDIKGADEVAFIGTGPFRIYEK